MRELNEKDFNNAETLAKRFNLKKMAETEKTGKDYCDLMDKILKDTKKRRRLINVTRVAEMVVIATSGFLHGQVVGNAMNEKDAAKALVAIGSAAGVYNLTDSLATKIIDGLKKDITDNIAFSADLGAVVLEHDIAENAEMDAAIDAAFKESAEIEAANEETKRAE